MFATIVLDIYENPRGKNFINTFCPKHPKMINWNRISHKFLLSHFFSQKGFMKDGSLHKKIISFSPLILDWDKKDYDCVFVELPFYAISISLATDT